MARSPGDEDDVPSPSVDEPGANRTALRHWIGGIGTLTRRIVWAVVLLLLALVCVRAYQSTQGPPLRPWHTIVPDELSADAIAARRLARRTSRPRTRMFEQLHRRLQSKHEAGDRTPLNRYYDASLDLARGASVATGTAPSCSNPSAHAAWRGRAAARPDRFPVQHAQPRRAVSAARLHRHRAAHARTRHGAGGADAAKAARSGRRRSRWRWPKPAVAPVATCRSTWSATRTARALAMLHVMRANRARRARATSTASC